MKVKNVHLPALHRDCGFLLNHKLEHDDVVYLKNAPAQDDCAHYDLRIKKVG